MIAATGVLATRRSSKNGYFSADLLLDLNKTTWASYVV